MAKPKLEHVKSSIITDIDKGTLKALPDRDAAETFIHAQLDDIFEALCPHDNMKAQTKQQNTLFVEKKKAEFSAALDKIDEIDETAWRDLAKTTTRDIAIMLDWEIDYDATGVPGIGKIPVQPGELRSKPVAERFEPAAHLKPIFDYLDKQDVDWPGLSWAGLGDAKNEYSHEETKIKQSLIQLTSTPLVRKYLEDPTNHAKLAKGIKPLIIAWLAEKPSHTDLGATSRYEVDEGDENNFITNILEPYFSDLEAELTDEKAKGFVKPVRFFQNIHRIIDISPTLDIKLAAPNYTTITLEKVKNDWAKIAEALNAKQAELNTQKEALLKDSAIKANPAAATILTDIDIASLTFEKAALPAEADYPAVLEKIKKLTAAKTKLKFAETFKDPFASQIDKLNEEIKILNGTIADKEKIINDKLPELKGVIEKLYNPTAADETKKGPLGKIEKTDDAWKKFNLGKLKSLCERVQSLDKDSYLVTIEELITEFNSYMDTHLKEKAVADFIGTHADEVKAIRESMLGKDGLKTKLDTLKKEVEDAKARKKEIDDLKAEIEKLKKEIDEAKEAKKETPSAKTDLGKKKKKGTAKTKPRYAPDSKVTTALSALRKDLAKPETRKDVLKLAKITAAIEKGKTYTIDFGNKPPKTNAAEQLITLGDLFKAHKIKIKYERTKGRTDGPEVILIYDEKTHQYYKEGATDAEKAHPKRMKVWTGDKITVVKLTADDAPAAAAGDDAIDGAAAAADGDTDSADHDASAIIEIADGGVSTPVIEESSVYDGVEATKKAILERADKAHNKKLALEAVQGPLDYYEISDRDLRQIGEVMLKCIENYIGHVEEGAEIPTIEYLLHKMAIAEDKTKIRIPYPVNGVPPEGGHITMDFWEFWSTNAGEEKKKLGKYLRNLAFNIDDQYGKIRKHAGHGDKDTMSYTKLKKELNAAETKPNPKKAKEQVIADWIRKALAAGHLAEGPVRVARRRLAVAVPEIKIFPKKKDLQKDFLANIPSSALIAAYKKAKGGNGKMKESHFSDDSAKKHYKKLIGKQPAIETANARKQMYQIGEVLSENTDFLEFIADKKTEIEHGGRHESASWALNVLIYYGVVECGERTLKTITARKDTIMKAAAEEESAEGDGP